MKKRQLPYGAIKEIANYFCVTPETVRRAINGKTYSVNSIKINKYIDEHFKNQQHD